jgi:hypothetical protein
VNSLGVDRVGCLRIVGLRANNLGVDSLRVSRPLACLRADNLGVYSLWDCRLRIVCLWADNQGVDSPSVGRLRIVCLRADNLGVDSLRVSRPLACLRADNLGVDSLFHSRLGIVGLRADNLGVDCLKVGCLKIVGLRADNLGVDSLKVGCLRIVGGSPKAEMAKRWNPKDGHSGAGSRMSQGNCYTGCSITPCSALSPTTCQRSADRRGGGSLPEEVGVRAGTGTYVLSPPEPAVGMAEAKCQQVTALLHAGVAVIDICRTLGVSERLILKVKKLVKQGKDLKIVRNGGPKAKKRTVAAIRRVAAGNRRDPKKSIRKLAAEHKMAPVL